MRNKGQSLVEFAIIIAVVVLGGIMVLTLLGGNVNEMFSKSVDKTSTYKPFDWGTPKSTASTTTTSSTSSTTSTPASSVNVKGVDVLVNTDGSASFTYKGQDVLLSSTAMSDMEIAIDTTGTDGTEILVSIVQDMIDKHKDEYPNSDVPIEILSGKSVRTDDGGNEYAYGNAELNLVTVKVGDSFKVFQNDTGGSAEDILKGKFMLEYNAGGDNDIKVTDENGKQVEVPGFEEDGSSRVEDFITYTDPATGKFYIVGEGDDGAGGSANDISDSGVTVPSGLVGIASSYFDSSGKPKDRVWLLEFNPNE